MKGGIYFRTKRLKKIAEEYLEATEAYRKLQAGLVREVVNIACKANSPCILDIPYLMAWLSATYGSVLEALDSLIAHLDVVVRCVNQLILVKRDMDNIRQLCTCRRQCSDTICKTYCHSKGYDFICNVVHSG